MLHIVSKNWGWGSWGNETGMVWPWQASLCKWAKVDVAKRGHEHSGQRALVVVQRNGGALKNKCLSPLSVLCRLSEGSSVLSQRQSLACFCVRGLDVISPRVLLQHQYRRLLDSLHLLTWTHKPKAGIWRLVFLSMHCNMLLEDWLKKNNCMITYKR